MRVGVSTACLYPDLLEDSLLSLMDNGINHVEIFVNTDSELEKKFVSNMADILKNYNATCKSLHPYTCAMEPMMFFSGYERRVVDVLEYYKRYFEAMNILGAEVFVFHGNKAGLQTPDEFYFERFSKLVKVGKEFGVTIAQENVSRCQSSTLKFQKAMCNALGDDAKFVLDTKQAIRSGEDPFETVRELGQNIIHVHLSDYGKNGDCLPIGAGEFDIKGFMTLLHNMNFDGSVMLELYRYNFTDVSDLADNFNTLKALLKSIKEA